MKLEKDLKKRTNNQYALLSVFDKTGIVDLAKQLTSLGYQVISTGGTAKVLAENGLLFTPVQEITGNPECFDGRMKTISFQIESGILYDHANPTHCQQAKELKICPIKIVICNLYPFEKTIQNPKVSFKEAIENIDVGGLTMIRAAAKNFLNVLVVVDPKDYPKFCSVLKDGKPSLTFHQKLAAKAFGHLSFYDSQIARFFSKKAFPKELTIPGRKVLHLRYGENPHQKAAFYLEPNTSSPLKNLQRISGRELSLVNLTDINAGLQSLQLFSTPAAVVIKHNSPCGIALGKTPSQALDRAIKADPESAFGGWWF